MYSVRVCLLTFSCEVLASAWLCPRHVVIVEVPEQISDPCGGRLKLPSFCKMLPATNNDELTASCVVLLQGSAEWGQWDGHGLV